MDIEEYKDEDGLYPTRWVWKDFKPCLCCGETENECYEESIDVYVKEIWEYEKKLIERDYYRRPVYCYNYRFKLHCDDKIYVLDANIRMFKFYSAKWHWFSKDTNTRLYSTTSDAKWEETYAATSKDKEWRNYLDDESFSYDSDDEYEDFEEPFTGLTFRNELPADATEIEIPKYWDDDLLPAQKVALILLFVEGEPFESGK